MMATLLLDTYQSWTVGHKEVAVYGKKGAYGAVCSIGKIRHRMFPCSDWATTPMLENIPYSLGLY